MTKVNNKKISLKKTREVILRYIANITYNRTRRIKNNYAFCTPLQYPYKSQIDGINHKGNK